MWGVRVSLNELSLRVNSHVEWSPVSSTLESGDKLQYYTNQRVIKVQNQEE